MPRAVLDGFLALEFQLLSFCISFSKHRNCSGVSNSLAISFGLTCESGGLGLKLTIVSRVVTTINPFNRLIALELE